MEMASQSADRVLLLGPLQVIQNGRQLSQPPSRKVRALLAYRGPFPGKNCASSFGMSRMTREANYAGAFPSCGR